MKSFVQDSIVNQEQCSNHPSQGLGMAANFCHTIQKLI